MTRRGTLLASLVADTAKAQNTDFLAADFSVKWPDSVVRITIAASNVVYLLVPSSGTAITLNAGTALTAAAAYTFEHALDTGRTWNVQTNDGSGGTINHLVIQELEA